jgi:hypothetical protein
MMMMPGGQAIHRLDVLSYGTEMTAAAGGGWWAWAVS